jgi:hypothetical protein
MVLDEIPYTYKETTSQALSSNHSLTLQLTTKDSGCMNA